METSLVTSSVIAELQAQFDASIAKVNALEAALNLFTTDFANQLNNLIKPGAIIIYAYSSVPLGGWLPCEGQAVSRLTYASLFVVIGTIYGSGDGINTFNLPDFSGRAPIGSGAGGGLTPRTLGEKLGSETHALTADENGPHTHDLMLDSHHFDQDGTGNKYVRPTSVENFLKTTQISGGGSPHNNMPPSLAVKFFIKY